MVGFITFTVAGLRLLSISLREKCPKTMFFLLRIYLYSVQIQGKYGAEKTLHLDTFHADYNG